MLNVKDEIFDGRDEFGRWVVHVDDSKSVLEGDNEAFPVQNNNKKGEKIRSNLPTRALVKNFVRSSKILEDRHEDLLRSYCGSSARSPRIFAKIVKDL